MQQDLFGLTPAGEAVYVYTLRNTAGMAVRLLDYGATLMQCWVPDREGHFGDVVLGCDTLHDYIQHSPYFGATVGRVANRIANARYAREGRTWQLDHNDGKHHLHGGHQGFDKRVWRVESIAGERNALDFHLLSPDGDGGYPGELAVSVRYTLLEDNSLQIDYSARTSALTPCNLSNHSYWNLACHDSVLQHTLALHAEHYLEVDPELIPTGRVLPVADTPFDFRRARALGRDLQVLPDGYDHNFVVAAARRSQPEPAAELYDPESGRYLQVYTTEPGIQCYTGNFLNGVPGKAGASYARFGGICLETQMFPDAVHHDHFPSVWLHPGEHYHQHTRYAFSLR
ncbi:galactose mutarotase [Pseudohalioglobus sediminis]|uniref:Aldose 1-epimerase n=1 Tax=Pseudohalioglobus sediminis TaxID=2606449 RepID=A0A5B0WZM8_9GAMM|nr:aldose epimerase family protein [Pseudohalioglobus sediminis]KAA1192512.1 galactose mutarotase [Pseudohalioglobus sediminis]